MRRLGVGRTMVGLFLLACAGPVRAQSWEVSGLFGYTPSAGLGRRAPELDQLDIASGLTWGAQAGRRFTPRIAAEVMWTRQSSGLESEGEGERARFFTFAVSDLHANFVYHLADDAARFRPFVFAGAGASFLGGGDLPSETKLSLGLGGGVKLFPWKAVGMRAQGRYKPVFLDDEDSGTSAFPSLLPGLAQPDSVRHWRDPAVLSTFSVGSMAVRRRAEWCEPDDFANALPCAARSGDHLPDGQRVRPGQRCDTVSDSGGKRSG